MTDVQRQGRIPSSTRDGPDRNTVDDDRGELTQPEWPRSAGDLIVRGHPARDEHAAARRQYSRHAPSRARSALRTSSGIPDGMVPHPIIPSRMSGPSKGTERLVNTFDADPDGNPYKLSIVGSVSSAALEIRRDQDGEAGGQK